MNLRHLSQQSLLDDLTLTNKKYIVMKKNYLLSFVCATLLFTSCGTGGGIASGTGSTGAALAGSSNSTTSLLTSAGTGVLGTLMSTLLGNTTTTNSSQCLTQCFT